MFKTFKVGGMRFVQIGQLSVSFCFTQKRAPFLDALAMDTKVFMVVYAVWFVVVAVGVTFTIAAI